MIEQISPEIQEERSKKVIELSNRIRGEYNKLFVGKIVDVLVEEKEGKKYKGHTPNYLYVEIKNCNNELKNKIEKVYIQGYSEDTLEGEII